MTPRRNVARLFLLAFLSLGCWRAAAQEALDQVFNYADPTAKAVAVAGEFSNWSALPMTKDDAGLWSRTIHVKPGYYAYKFVVNGEWILDPANPTRKIINDIENSAVSVGGVPPSATPTSAAKPPGDKTPVTFSFTDAGAESVHVAGEFNAWLDNTGGKITGHSEWLMQNDGAGNWKLTAPLAPGKYKFKYVVDDGARWEKDRILPASADDNSVVEVKAGGTSVAPAPVAAGGGPTTFTFTDAKATSIHVAGEFNNWLDNTEGKVTGHSEWQMQNDGAGNWKLTMQLPPGKHKFKYAIDGGPRWEQDPRLPASPDGNSIIEATPGAAPSATGTTFTYADPAAASVALAGDFNQWSATANPMQKDASGIWTAALPLKAGKYQYKFVVDSNWKVDPANPDAAEDGYGGKNSVKIVQ